jgi:hypothetical protein
VDEALSMVFFAVNCIVMSYLFGFMYSAGAAGHQHSHGHVLLPQALYTMDGLNDKDVFMILVYHHRHHRLGDHRMAAARALRCRAAAARLGNPLSPAHRVRPGASRRIQSASSRALPANRPDGGSIGLIMRRPALSTQDCIRKP